MQKGPPAYLEELTCPCCLPALGEFGEVPPHEGSRSTLDGMQVPASCGPGPRSHSIVGYRAEFPVRQCLHV